MRRIILLFVFVLSAAFALKAERIIVRERYTITIPYDTVFASEAYDLYVKIKSKDSVKIYFDKLDTYTSTYQREEPPMNNGVTYFKTRTKGDMYSSNNHTEYIKIQISFSDTMFIENMECYVKEFNMRKFGIQNVIDSLHRFTSTDPRFNSLGDLNASRGHNKKYGRISDYISDKFHLRDSLGQLSIALIVDPEGRVVTIEVITNTYKAVDIAELNAAIKAYRFSKKHPQSPFQRNVYVKDKNNVEFSMYFKTVQLIRGKALRGQSFVGYNDWL
ncbi:hypothetical protein [Cytophaga aurantiaca]|uniref:hypothetical protein n=1 Tax=Cytophaga aurantiaca TaxID=29530 RepID=UPI00036E8359|nr:hypothetical protein [Cytophaga aurantiaca]